MIQKLRAPAFIWMELIGLFVILPLLYYFDLIPFHKIVPLILLFIYCAAVLFSFKAIRRETFRLEASWRVITLRFALTAALISVGLIFSSQPLFSNLNENRKLLYMITLYPFLSAFPQELIFREFFFYRYGSLFKSKHLLVASNVLLFAFAHIYFGNWIVMAFTVIGGLLFAITFFRTRSLMVVTIEHSLYGLLVLSSGLSVYFYKAF